MKLRIGGALATLGGIGMVLGPQLGATTLGSPWSFLVGLLVGVVAGIGAGFAIFGLIEVRRAR